VLWEVSDIGFGWASTAVVKGTVYTSGHVGDNMAVTAIDSSGTKLWQTVIDKVAKNGHQGARSTPTVDGDLLYVQSDAGSLFCLKTADGSKVWSVNLVEQFGGKPPYWFYAENLLVDGDRVLACPGAKSAIMAFNKKTGEKLWASEALDGEATYASPRVMPLGKLRQIVGFTAKNVFGVDSETGLMLWSFKNENGHGVSATPVVFKDDVLYATCGYGKGGQGLKLAAADGKITVTQLWTNPAPDDQDGGVVLVDGKIFGTGQVHKGLTAVDLARGKTLFTNQDVEQGSTIFADGRLYCAGQSGTVRLCDPRAEGQVLSKFTIEVKQKGQMWAHPAISDGKLYLRHDSTLTVYDIKATAAK
jgi:outer membrane protein assembly factor BamB